jgi:hypothetical protein
MRSPYSDDDSLAARAIPDPSRTVRKLPALNEIQLRVLLGVTRGMLAVTGRNESLKP